PTRRVTRDGRYRGSRKDRRTRQRPGIRMNAVVMPLTGAERSRRYRQKRRAKRDVTSPSPTAERPVTRCVTRPIVPITTLLAALGVAVAAAGFAIIGLTTMFAGAFWAISYMGIALEGGKLAAVAWLGQRHGSRPLRATVVTLVAALMTLNAAGCYGFLAR